MKKCIYCDREFSIKEILGFNNIDNIKCPYCTKELKVNKISKLLYASVLILIDSLIIAFPLTFLIKVMYVSIWSLFSAYLLRPYIYVYE